MNATRKLKVYEAVFTAMTEQVDASEAHKLVVAIRGQLGPNTTDSLDDKHGRCEGKGKLHTTETNAKTDQETINPMWVEPPRNFKRALHAADAPTGEMQRPPTSDALTTAVQSDRPQEGDAIKRALRLSAGAADLDQNPGRFPRSGRVSELPRSSGSVKCWADLGALIVMVGQQKEFIGQVHFALAQSLKALKRAMGAAALQKKRSGQRQNEPDDAAKADLPRGVEQATAKLEFSKNAAYFALDRKSAGRASVRGTNAAAACEVRRAFLSGYVPNCFRHWFESNLLPSVRWLVSGAIHMRLVDSCALCNGVARGDFEVGKQLDVLSASVAPAAPAAETQSCVAARRRPWPLAAPDAQRMSSWERGPALVPVQARGMPRSPPAVPVLAHVASNASVGSVVAVAGPPRTPRLAALLATGAPPPLPGAAGCGR
ncbi:unnamed protein product, partial [Prorocentrum cordatum]